MNHAPQTTEITADEVVRSIEIDLIDDHPDNRKNFNADELESLADSLAEKGQTTPAIVRPKANGRFELIAGGRRKRACLMRGITRLKCVVREMDDGEALEQLLLENKQRADLSPIDEANIYQRLLDLKDEQGANLYTRKRIAARVLGNEKHEFKVRSSLSLLSLPPAMKSALESGAVKPRAAYLVSRAPSEDLRQAAAEYVLAGERTVKEVQAWMQTHCMVNLVGAPFDLDEPYILTDADRQAFGFTLETDCENDGSCLRCKSMVGNNEEFADSVGDFGGGKGGVHPRTCLKPSCYHRKVEQVYRDEAEDLAERHAGKPHVDSPPAKVLLPADVESWFFANMLKPNAPVVAYDDASPYGPKGGKALPWSDVIKGELVPLSVCRRPGTETFIVLADKTLSMHIAKERFPHCFEPESETSVTAAPPAKSKTATNRKPADDDARAKALAKKAAAREQLIASETNMDSLRELHEALLREPSIGIEVLSMFWRMIVRQHQRIDLLGRYVGALKPEDEWEDELREWPELQGTPYSELVALIGVALVIEDVNESGALIAADFNDFCKLLKVSPKAVEKRVRKAHELAERQEAANKPPPKKREGGDSSAGSGDSGVITCSKCQYQATSVAALQKHVCKGDKPEKLSPKDLACKLLEPVSATQPNDHGVFEDALDNRHEVQVTKKGDFAFSIGLARDKDFNWYYGFEVKTSNGAGVGGPSMDAYPAREKAINAAIAEVRDCALRGGIEHGATAKTGEGYSRMIEALDAVQAELDVWDLEGIEKSDRETQDDVEPVSDADEPDAIDDLIDRIRFYRDQNPKSTVQRAAEDLGAPYEDVSRIWDQLIDEEFAPRIEAEAKQKEIDALKAQREAMPTKPKKSKDPEGFKAWDRERKSIARALERLQKGASL